jgi:hypothetical protein
VFSRKVVLTATMCKNFVCWSEIDEDEAKCNPGRSV